MKVTPIHFTEDQLWIRVRRGDIQLPLRIEVEIRDAGPYMLERHTERLTRLNYVLGIYRDERSRRTITTATQRDPIEQLLRATRALAVGACPTHLYQEMGLRGEELSIAIDSIYTHVRQEFMQDRLLPFARDRLPLSWQQPRYQWENGQSLTSGRTVRNWVEETLGRSFDPDPAFRTRPSVPRPIRDGTDAYAALQSTFSQLGASATSATTAFERLGHALEEPPAPPISQTLRAFLDRQGREIEQEIGIPAAVLAALSKPRPSPPPTGNGGQPTTHRAACARPTAAPASRTLPHPPHAMSFPFAIGIHLKSAA
jgi:hypothetical protein